MMEIEQMMDRPLARMEAKMDANQVEIKADRARTEANKEEMLARMQRNAQAMREIKSGQAEMKSTDVFRVKMDACVANIKEARQDTTEADPEMMQSVWEHLEVPKEDVSVFRYSFGPN
jgi:seryl-tRNA synthetase